MLPSPISQLPVELLSDILVRCGVWQGDTVAPWATPGDTTREAMTGASVCREWRDVLASVPSTSERAQLATDILFIELVTSVDVMNDTKLYMMWLNEDHELQTEVDGFLYPSPAKEFSLLNYACAFDPAPNLRAVRHLLRHGWGRYGDEDVIDIDVRLQIQTDDALTVASQNGRIAVVRALLDPASQASGVENARRAHADANSSYAMRMAAMNGHADVVRVLFDASITGDAHRARADAGDNFALTMASTNGHADVVRLLLDPAVAGEHRALADDSESWALVSAAENGHEDVVRLLLDASITGDAHRARADDDGSDCLEWAATNGHLGVMRLLLDPAVAGEHHALADDNDSRALVTAAENGHSGIVRLLLDPAVTGKDNVAQVSARGYESLIRAAANGHAGVVWELLSCGGARRRCPAAAIGEARDAALKNGHSDVILMLTGST